MLRFKARRKSPALKPQGELTASERRVIRLMDDAMQALRRDVQRRQAAIIDAIAHRSADFVADMITDDPWYDAQKQLQGELYGELLDAGSRVTLRPMEKATLRFSFDRTRPEAAAWARDEAGGLIREVVGSQRDMVRTLVGNAQAAGVAPVDVARQIRGGIGLTTAQAGWVDNFYNRALTDNIMAGMSPAQAAARAQAAADRYQQQVHRYRSMTIARTEIMRANSEGRQQAWAQGLAGGWISPNALKEWNAEADACEICMPLNGMRVPLKGQFPNGEPPAHPNCRCDVLLVEDIPADITQMTDAELDAELERLITGTPAPATPPLPEPVLQVLPRNLTFEQKRSWIEQRVDHAVVDRLKALKGGTNPNWRDGNPMEASLDYYTGNGFRTMNGYLRERAAGVTTPPPNKSGLSVLQSIDEVNAAIDAAKPLDEPLLVYRGMRQIPDGFEAGKIFTEPGFMSTSVNRNISEGFKRTDGIILEIVAPRGTRAIVAEEFEDEVLFRSGTKLRVISIQIVNGQRTAYCEIVP